MSGVTAYAGGQAVNAMHLDKVLGGISSPLVKNVLGGQIGGSLTGGAFGGLQSATNGQNFWAGVWDGTKMGLVTGTISGFGNAVQFSDKNNVNLFSGKPNPVMERPVTPQALPIPEVGVDGSEKPSQIHHFATDKNQQYTPQMKEITDKYDLDLDDDWNKGEMPHLGRHPNDYHQWVLDNMQTINSMPNMNQQQFKIEFNIQVRQPVMQNPLMLNKIFWK